jgi:putative holliday junction resolvase
VTILALDVGKKRIGVAASDAGETFAFPVATIERTNIHTDLERIVAYVDEYAVQEVVVGDPITLSGERGIASQQIDAFVAHLRRAFSGTIHRVDERMTTAQATRALIAADLTRRKRKETVDKIAAVLILESFLARRRRQH